MNRKIVLLMILTACATVATSLPGCGTAPIEGQQASSNPAADDYCRRNPESVLCSTSR